ncbi:ScbA/BarX family gamma-butyrolactone biosynthesis protein [Arthrobacter sp. AK01]|uniref:ScbA/BarX family gamma-butyrolactone biosynthesis protein n=1 Tax=Arthrobacter sp. AK01 TaxID=2894084 RepID=UPI0035AB7DB4
MTQNISTTADWRDPQFRSTVSRELVHRRSVSEVFPTAITKASETEFTVCAQWPRWHVFYAPPNSSFDSALVVETLRQLTVLIAHTYLRVPLGSPFLMPQIGVVMEANCSRDASRPVEVTAKVQVTNQRTSRHGVATFGTAAVFVVDGQEIARGDATARIVDPAIYSRLRNAHVPSSTAGLVQPASAGDVGHLSDWNVVVGRPTEQRRWPLRVDTTNPILFDHPLDHIPGVLLIEAVRQALRLEFEDPGLDFAAFESQFLAVAELGAEHDVVLESLTDDHGTLLAVAGVHAGDDVLMRTVARIRRQPPQPFALRPSSRLPRQQVLPDPGQNSHG